MNSTAVMILMVIATVIIAGFIAFSFVSGNGFKYDFTPQGRLNADSNLVAACQYEMWDNTTQQIPTVESDGVHNENKTEVYWVCYYRDHITTQPIGAFTDIIAASNYIWYYYENGHYPFIVEKK